MNHYTYQILLNRKDNSDEVIGHVVLEHEQQDQDLSVQAISEAGAQFQSAALPGMIQFQSCMFPLADVKSIAAVCVKIELLP